MKHRFLPVVIALFLAVSSFAYIATVNWSIAKDYAVKFKDSKADGVFETMKGTIVFDEKNAAAGKFDITIDVASINTGIGLKNKHAKGSKWFDAEKYPTIHFASTSVAKRGAGYEVTGNLTLHGVTKPVTIPFTFENNSGKGVFKGTFKINRNQFGIGDNDKKDPDITSLDVTVPVTAKQ